MTEARTSRRKKVVVADDVHGRLKARAALRGITLEALTDEVLRNAVERLERQDA